MNAGAPGAGAPGAIGGVGTTIGPRGATGARGARYRGADGAAPGAAAFVEPLSPTACGFALPVPFFDQSYVFTRSDWNGSFFTSNPSSTAPAHTMDESASSGDEGDASVPTELGSGIEGDAIDWGGGWLNRSVRRLRRADWETSKMVLSLVGGISWER